MGDALLELVANIRSGKEQLTQEENIFKRCKSQALNWLAAGAIAEGGLVRAVTSKLHRLLRITLSGGGATILGFGELDNSVDSSVDHFLSLDGTRIQRELANMHIRNMVTKIHAWSIGSSTRLTGLTSLGLIVHMLPLTVRIVKKYQHDPGMMQLISKHLYLEEVFDDSTSEPRLRWRYRNFFSDNINQDQGTHDDSQHISHNTTPSDIHDNYKRKRTIFGYMATSEEIHHTTPSSMPSRAQSRAHKRAHRRRQMRLRESLGSHDSKHSN